MHDMFGRGGIRIGGCLSFTPILLLFRNNINIFFKEDQQKKNDPIYLKKIIKKTDQISFSRISANTLIHCFWKNIGKNVHFLKNGGKNVDLFYRISTKCWFSKEYRQKRWFNLFLKSIGKYTDLFFRNIRKNIYQSY